MTRRKRPLSRKEATGEKGTRPARRTTWTSDVAKEMNGRRNLQIAMQKELN